MPPASLGRLADPGAVPALLAAAGITTVSTEIVADEEAARTAATRLGYPVVLKGTGPRLLHKTESHAVITRLADEPSMLTAFHALARRVDVEHVVIQPMIEGGAEMFVGATFDTAFGHLIVCGGGGTTVELLRDTAHRLARAPRPASERCSTRCGRHDSSGVSAAQYWMSQPFAK